MKLKKKYLKYGIIIFVILLVLFLIFRNANKPYYPDIYTPRPVLGNESARITITEFSDLQCPACIAAYPAVKRIISEFENDIKFEYFHYPLSYHKYSFKAAEASECANDQGKFWEFLDKAYSSNEDLAIENLKKYAAELSLDMLNFSNCLDSGAKALYVNRELREGDSRQVDATPTFFINGEKLNSWKYENFKQKIIEEMNK